MKNLGFLVLITIFFLFVPFFISGISCTTDSDCPSGYICQSNICSRQRGVSVTMEIPGVLPPSGPGGGVVIRTGKVVFKGKAYPKAFLTLSKNDKIAATFSAESSGFFEKELSGVRGGTYNFGIFAEDSEGRKSVTLTFKITVLPDATITISGIFIPPTISLSRTRVEKGQKTNILGQAFPESKIYILILPGEIVKETITDLRGKWFFELETGVLEKGEYKIQARAFLENGEQSQFSQSISLEIIEPICRGADLNFDEKVDIIDFSILLYFWRVSNPENVCVDINKDGLVDLVDFSIMMHQWTD